MCSWLHSTGSCCDAESRTRRWIPSCRNRSSMNRSRRSIRHLFRHTSSLNSPKCVSTAKSPYNGTKTKTHKAPNLHNPRQWLKASVTLCESIPFTTHPRIDTHAFAPDFAYKQTHRRSPRATQGQESFGRPKNPAVLPNLDLRKVCRKKKSTLHFQKLRNSAKTKLFPTSAIAEMANHSVQAADSVRFY